MKKTLKYCSALLLTLALNTSAASAETSHPSFVRLPGHVPSEAIAKAVLLKNMDPDEQVSVAFTLPLRNQKDLEELLQRIYDPADQEHYGKFLSSEEFIEKFAPTEEDYNKVTAYAEILGLTVHLTHPNRTLLHVAGPAKSIASAFKVNLHHYQHADGRKFYAPDNDPEVHVSIASVIGGVVGLDNQALWRPYHRKHKSGEPTHAGSRSFPSGPGGGFAPQDLIKAYNLSGVQENGSNQIIALFELASYLASDINQYAHFFGLPAPQLKNVLVDGGSKSGIDAEVTLDIELALALAPASQIYVYEGPNSNQGVLDTYNRIATDNIAKQVSTSWGLGENLVNAQYLNAENAIFQQMAAQGQTMYAAAGDSGAYDDYGNNSSKTLVVDDPASQPYVVGVGGTRLSVNSATGVYKSESVWNDGLGNGAGGGGVSKVWSIPSWQSKVSTLYSKTHRNVPDVSLNADPNSGYAIYYNGQWQIYGGTSCAAPLWAAFTALINQQLAAAHKPVLGFANPLFYAIGTGAAYLTDFHDITTGNNLFYKAQAGYDNASGWGSFNGANLFKILTNPSVALELSK